MPKKRQPVEIGGVTFASNAALKRYAAAIVAATPDGEFMDAGGAEFFKKLVLSRL